MKLKQKQLTITGKKYFSTVPGVRTSAHDPKGLKYKSCLLFKRKSHHKQHKTSKPTKKLIAIIVNGMMQLSRKT